MGIEDCIGPIEKKLLISNLVHTVQIEWLYIFLGGRPVLVPVNGNWRRRRHAKPLVLFGTWSSQWRQLRKERGFGGKLRRAWREYCYCSRKNYLTNLYFF